MELSCEDHFPRFHGTVKENAFSSRPSCAKCGHPLRISSHSRPRFIVGLLEDYQSTTAYYWCGNPLCPGFKSNPVHPENADVPPLGTFDYDVLAKVCELRWGSRLTYDEIVSELGARYHIGMCTNTVERILKTYEVGCEGRYRPEYVAKIRANGGVILTVDCMQPLKGEKGVYAAYDHLTGLALGSRRLPNQREETIATFLDEVRARIAADLDVPVIGIISDALPSQRLAIEQVFPGIPHCLCHFHFYNLVLLAPMAMDSHVVTTLRAGLRDLHELKQYKVKFGTTAAGVPPPPTLVHQVLATLVELSNWARRPKDPAFTGLELHGRISGVLGLLREVVAELDAGSITLEEAHSMRHLLSNLESLLAGIAGNVAELSRIRDHLGELAEIVGDLDTTAKTGLKRLRALRDKLRRVRLTPACGATEREFIEALMKFVGTKGELLFNYKLVPGAPTTNNAHELKYKQLKHLLRRVVGFTAASTYLLAHGERLVFVDPTEKFASILAILKSVDYAEVQKTIAGERKSSDRLTLLLHAPEKWEEHLKAMYLLLEDLKKRKTIIC